MLAGGGDGTRREGDNGFLFPYTGFINIFLFSFNLPWIIFKGTLEIGLDEECEELFDTFDTGLTFAGWINLCS